MSNWQKLILAECPYPLVDAYTYSPTEEQVYQDNGTINEATVYVSTSCAPVIINCGTFDYTYVYHQGALVAQSVNETKLFIHGNHEGSSSVVTNASGQVVERTEYSPFGEQLNNSVVRFGYEGKETDSLVGDTDFNFRKYTPEWGLFTQPDSITPNVYNPQSLNKYSFEKNSPSNRIDDTGHADWSSIGNSRAFVYSIITGFRLSFSYAWSGDFASFKDANRDTVMYSIEVLNGGVRVASGVPPSSEEVSLSNVGNLLTSTAQSVTLNPNNFDNEEAPLINDHYKKLREELEKEVQPIIPPTNFYTPYSPLACYPTNINTNNARQMGTSPYGITGKQIIYISSGGGKFPTANPNWKPRPAGTPGGMGGGSSFGDGGFGSKKNNN